MSNPSGILNRLAAHQHPAPILDLSRPLLVDEKEFHRLPGSLPIAAIDAVVRGRECDIQGRLPLAVVDDRDKPVALGDSRRVRGYVVGRLIGGALQHQPSPLGLDRDNGQISSHDSPLR